MGVDTAGVYEYVSSLLTKLQSNLLFESEQLNEAHDLLKTSNFLTVARMPEVPFCTVLLSKTEFDKINLN